jgi:hypothetical protein
LISTQKRPRRARGTFAFVTCLLLAARAPAASLTNDTFSVQIGNSGEISSLKLVGDAFPTDYVLNASNAPGQDTADHEWVGELMFSYRSGNGAWQTALTQSSSDVRHVDSTSTSVTVSYENSANPNGIHGFSVAETYSLSGAYLLWQIAIKNTSAQSVELGDVGLPLPFNEFWKQDNDVIYETRTVYHSFTGGDASYITVQRPSGVGPYLLMIPDAATGAHFEYMDNWVKSEHPSSTWVAGGGTPAWNNGLDVFYIHSNAIKKTNRGYLPNTSLMLAAGETKTYGFKFLKVNREADVKSALYREGLIDVTAVPGMVVASDMTAKFDLHTNQKIAAVTPQYPSETALSALGGTNDHNIYQVAFSHLGQNDVDVSYGNGLSTKLQFYVLERLEAALKRHADFIVNKTVANTGPLAKVFDDWMLDTRSVRGATGGSGWGDDWGWTHGQFLAEKDAQTPVATEVKALDDYLDAVWNNAIDHSTFVVQDWWCPSGTSAANPNNCFYNRPYAYPHAFNTYFSMYKIASRYPKLARQTAETYLMRAYGILHSLYSGGPPPPKAPATIAGTGYMGEQTLPDIQRALSAAGHTSEASFVQGAIANLHSAFSGNPYPFGSEYKYDNTGEEAVYMAAKESGDTDVLGKVNAKTRACRGHEPVWYYYTDPVTLNGENWWQFQYTVSLAGYCMDDWVRHHSTTPEVDERLSYAAKIANLNAINSGQIDSNPENLGAVAWTYQAMKGNVYVNSFEPATSTLHNGWRQMAGEADLGLFGALRILSADVVMDPIFGLFGYGSDVSMSGSCYSVTPKDGVFKRLNMISQKLYVELDRDRYGGATVSASNDYLGFTLENQTGDAHTTNVTVDGLAAGIYSVDVDGTTASMITATSGAVTQIALSVGAGATHTVSVHTPMPSCSGVGGATGNGSGGTQSVGGSTSGGGSTGSSGGMAMSPGAAGVNGAAGSGTAVSGAAGAVTASGGAAGNSGTAGSPQLPGNAEGGSGSSCGCRLSSGPRRPYGTRFVMFSALALAALRRRGQRRKTRASASG